MATDADDGRIVLQATHLYALGRVRFNLTLTQEGEERPCWPLDNGLILHDNRVDVARFYVSWALWFSQGVGKGGSLSNDQLFTLREFQNEAWLHLSKALIGISNPKDSELLTDATEKLETCNKLVETLTQQR